MDRRRVIAAGIGSAVTGLAGCLGDASEETPPDPVDLEGKFDTDHGMEIGPHGGANGQIFYRDADPRDEGNPAWFHTLVHSLFPYHFDRLDRGAVIRRRLLRRIHDVLIVRGGNGPRSDRARATRRGDTRGRDARRGAGRLSLRVAPRRSRLRLSVGCSRRPRPFSRNYSAGGREAIGTGSSGPYAGP